MRRIDSRLELVDKRLGAFQAVEVHRQVVHAHHPDIGCLLLRDLNNHRKPPENAPAPNCRTLSFQVRKR